MNYGESGGLSASDVALLTGNGGNNGGFGNNGDGWWIILLFLLGFGNRGFGGGFGGNGGGGPVDGYVLATDFATIERKLDSVNSGICDATFSLNNTITNGFANNMQAMTQGFSGLNTAIYQNAFNTERGLWNLGSQFADCCCKIERGIDGINYNAAMNTNALQQTLCNNTRDIIENANANYRALHEELIANKLEMKNERIAELTAKLERANDRVESQYIINELTPKCPQPAYVVNGPTPVNFPTNCCNQFSGFNTCGAGAY